MTESGALVPTLPHVLLCLPIMASTMSLASDPSRKTPLSIHVCPISMIQ